MRIDFPEILNVKLDRKPDFSGKVRDIFELDDRLLLVATDRLSAYDRILPNGIPGRGRILTQMSVFWFYKTVHIAPNHLITAEIDEFPEELKRFANQIESRSMLCRKARRIDIECVVRGYLAGSGWREYRESGRICGIRLPDGLVESERLPEPIFTPATKARHGEHDENISLERMCDTIGTELTEKLKNNALELYKYAAEYAISRGIIIADTKFEFGFIDGEIAVIDEMLSPDSSRFWKLTDYEPGRPQESFDKQFVRDWLADSGFTGDGPPPRLPDSIIEETLKRYLEIEDRLLGD